MSETDAPPRYLDAINEIEDILGELDAGDLDIDRLAPLVERASVLLRSCRERLSATELRVHEALERLTPDDPATPFD